MLEYQPLSSENHEIRLLTLTGGKRSAFVTCELKHYSLIDHPPYTALSYCWGNPDITKTIIVNGVKFQATINLEAALRQLQADGFTKMWVDAICINQNDREERSRQVLRMRRIYTEASIVVVWLGVETASSKATLNYIELLTKGKAALKYVQDIGGEDQHEGVKRARALMPPALQKFFDRFMYEPSEQFMDTLVEDLNNGFEVEGSIQGFMEFFQRPYWSRVWIIQEIIAASKVVVYCGSSSTKLENIEMVLKRTAEGKEFLRRGQVPNFEAFRKSQISGKASPLVKLLMSSRASLATDPRDKVFAMLGIASDGEELIPLPNYKQPLDSVLEDMTRSILSIQRCPNVLFFRSPDRTPTDRLPSWVPDWVELSRINRPWHSFLAGPEGDAAYIGEMVGNLHNLLAPFSRRMTTIVKPPIQFRGRILEMRGRVIDEVDGISSQTSDEVSTAQRERMRRMMVQSLKERSYYPSDHETAWAIAKCLSMDGIEFGTGLGSGKSSGYYARAFSELPRQRVRNYLENLNASLVDWLDENADFSISGQSLRDWMETAADAPVRGTEDSFNYSPTNRRVKHFLQRVAQVLGCGMRLASTKAGRVGMLHPQAKRGDVICTLLGCQMPIVLRRSGLEGPYNIVGEAYLHPIKKYLPGYLAENLELRGMIDFQIE